MPHPRVASARVAAHLRIAKKQKTKKRSTRLVATPLRLNHPRFALFTPLHIIHARTPPLPSKNTPPLKNTVFGVKNGFHISHFSKKHILPKNTPSTHLAGSGTPIQSKRLSTTHFRSLQINPLIQNGERPFKFIQKHIRDTPTLEAH